ncbi:MAG TPA: VOC family protein [Mycobacteriales bacterium]|nr:VOC family protein [Mycobacteriales bacterium]
MKPRITVITLAVRDLDRSVGFYRDGLGWDTPGIIGQEVENGAVAFFPLPGGLILALWPQEFLAADAHVPLGDQNTQTRFTLGHNVNSREEVDAVLAAATAAGATIVDPARDRLWGGYSGYFADPDGHLWDVVWNPEFPVAE